LFTHSKNLSARVGCALVVLAMVTNFCGCVNLDAVRQFAKTSAATADYKQVVADYAESPVRAMRYVTPDRVEKLKAQAALRAKQRPRLEAAQAVLVIYMSKLGDAAAGDLPKVDDEIDGFIKALETGKFVGDADGQIGNETATAAASLAKVVVRVLLDHWRQHEIAEVIQEVDPNIKAMVLGLKAVIETDFMQALDSEQEDVDVAFALWLRATKSFDDPSGLPPPAKIILQERLDAIERKREAAKKYVEALDKIGEGHASLANDKIKLDDEALKAQLKIYVTDLQTLYKSIKTLTN